MEVTPSAAQWFPTGRQAPGELANVSPKSSYGGARAEPYRAPPSGGGLTSVPSHSWRSQTSSGRRSRGYSNSSSSGPVLRMNRTRWCQP